MSGLLEAGLLNEDGFNPNPDVSDAVEIYTVTLGTERLEIPIPIIVLSHLKQWNFTGEKLLSHKGP